MAGDYALEPVETLDAVGRKAVRRIYEDGFPARLRADFAGLTEHREDDEAALVLLHGRQPCGFAMLRRLGRTGQTFLRYFVVDQRVRGLGLGGIMWDLLTDWLRADGCALLVFDVEDPAEPGCAPAEAQVRSRRIAFYQRHGAKVLPVRGYQTPHGADQDEDWTPMLLMAAPVGAGTPAPGADQARAIVAAVYQHRWRLQPGHPRVDATRVGTERPR